MRGFKTDKNGLWSPVHELYDNDAPMIVLAAMAALLFTGVVVQWWFI